MVNLNKLIIDLPSNCFKLSVKQQRFYKNNNSLSTNKLSGQNATKREKAIISHESLKP